MLMKHWAQYLAQRNTNTAFIFLQMLLINSHIWQILIEFLLGPSHCAKYKGI